MQRGPSPSACTYATHIGHRLVAKHALTPNTCDKVNTLCRSGPLRKSKSISCACRSSTKSLHATSDSTLRSRACFTTYLHTHERQCHPTSSARAHARDRNAVNHLEASRAACETLARRLRQTAADIQKWPHHTRWSFFTTATPRVQKKKACRRDAKLKEQRGMTISPYDGKHNTQRCGTARPAQVAGACLGACDMLSGLMSLHTAGARWRRQSRPG